MWDRVISAAGDKYGEDHDLTLTARSNLGLVWIDQGELDAARALYEELVEAKTANLGANDLSTNAARVILGYVLYVQGEMAEAISHCRRGIEVFDEAHGPAHLGTYGICARVTSRRRTAPCHTMLL